MKNSIFIILFVISSFAKGGAQNWKPIGPLNRVAGNGQGAGMIKTIAFHPKYNTADASIGGAINKTVFAGSPYGGIWITRDNGANWSNVDPLGQYPNLNTDFLRGCGVMDIVIDYNNPTTIYASMCSSEHGEGYTFGTADIIMKNFCPSTGVYKYTPSTGWISIVTYPYQSNHSVPALTINPVNPSIIFASTSDGIIKFTNSGTSWNTVLTNGIEKPFRNVVFDPSNSNEVYACGQEVYKSIDGGNTWSSISNFASIIPNNSSTILTNMVIKSSNSIYAAIVFLKNNNGIKSSEYVFYKYNGTTWTAMVMFPKQFEWTYDRFPLILKTVSGTDYVFAGQEKVQRYNSVTNTWTTISNYGGDMHPDIHDIVFSPDGSTLWVGHDGGVSSTYSNFYGSPAWATISKGLNIATIFSFAGAQKNPQIFITGETDNGNNHVNNADENNVGSISWKGYYMADGGDKMISWDNPNEWYDKRTMYGGPCFLHTTGIPGYANNQIFKTTTIDPIPQAQWHPHEQREFWGALAPMVMDPNNANIVYKGGVANVLLRSMNKGATSQVLFRKMDCFDIPNVDFFGNIQTIAIAPKNSNYLYVGFNNEHQWQPLFSNHIYKTTNALTPIYKGVCPHSATDGVVCSNWADITPPFTGSIAIKKRSKIESIVVSDKDPNLIWAGFSYNPGLPNFLVWMYDGTTWFDWGAGLPSNISITSIVYENGSNNGIYAGTDVGGIYYRNKSMNSWISYGTGMPHAYVKQMEINNIENTIRVGTKGRGIWKTSLYCPTGTLVKSNCVNCNSPTDDFWEGEKVFISSTTLNQSKLIIRGVDFIEMLPGTAIGSLVPLSSLLDSNGNPNLYYELYIHGCKPGDGNTY